jgi:hypothetical protein
VVTGHVWLVLAWLWLLWPVYVFARSRASRITVGALLLSVAMIVPTVPTICTFTAWSIGGFAP